MLKAITLASIAAAFCINLYFCLIFLRGYWQREDKKITAGLLLNALIIAMLAAEHCLPVRGGYDSALCFGIARETFFSLKSTYKEISPVLAYTITDLISQKSLHALLLQNMALSLINALMLFSCLRRIRLGMAAALCGTAFFCINFNNLIAAASMASTQCNLFYFISALAAALTPFYIQDIKKEYGKMLIWLISSSVLVITSRAELAPVPLLIFAAGILSKKRISEIPPLFSQKRKYIAMAGLAVCLICSINVLSGEGFKNRFGAHSPYINAVYQTVSNNFAMMAGNKAFLGKFSPPPLRHHIIFILCMGFAAFGCILFCGKYSDTEEKKKKIAISAAFFLAAAFLSFMYSPKDAYPLHFVRQRLYLFMALPFIVSFAAEGFFSKTGKKRAFIALISVLLAVYSFMNIKTAFSLNEEQRTDDKIWQFLIKNQEYISKKYDKMNFGKEWETSAVGILDKYYFPKYHERRKIAFFTPEYFLMNPKEKTGFSSKYAPISTEKTAYRHYFLPKMGVFEGQATEFGFYLPK
ncbi:MAG: hypothetical protein J5706_09420 [Elusimicrobiales bacterium]|nr:hypothetical protein [Elusimicrobiales bacterium]